MREIKFRAWDGERMHPVEQWQNKSWVAVPIPTNDGNGGVDWHLEQRKIDDIQLMQYTGLKDNKNNKEIYDGDIVELFGWGSQKSSDGYAVIGWDDDEIGWNFLAYYHKNNNYLIRINKPNYIQDRYEFRQAIENCIVIGNIYENPELLDNN